MPSRWKSIRYWFEWAIVRAVTAALPLLPRGWLLRLADGAAALWFRFDARSRRVAMENLRAAFPRLSERRRELIARGSARNFARTALSLFWSTRLTDATWNKWLIVEGTEAAAERRKQFGGTLVCGCHFGNFEWAAMSGGWTGVRGLVVAQEFKNPRLDAIFNNLRQQSGHRLTPRTQVALKMLRAIKGGRRDDDNAAGLLVDMTLPPEMPTVALRAFGGLRICASVLHALLHERTGVPLTPLVGFPRRDGTVRVVFDAPVPLPAGATRVQIAQATWDYFEALIRRRPSLWLWSYKHFRYRPEHPEKPFPWYAMEHPAFEKLVTENPAGASSP